MEPEQPESETRYLRGSPGKLSPERALDLGIELLRERRLIIANTGKCPRHLTYRKIAVTVGVFSHVTIANWDHLDMSPDAILERKIAQRKPRKFTTFEETILAGFIIYRDLTYQPTTTGIFREFVYTYFAEYVSPSFITKFMTRNHLSLKLVGNAILKELDRTAIVTESVQWLNALSLVITTYGLRLDQIKVYKLA